MAKKNDLTQMPPNWKLTALAKAANDAHKSYSIFYAENIMPNPGLAEEIYEQYRTDYIARRKEEAERIRRKNAADRQKKRREKLAAKSVEFPELAVPAI